MDRIASLANSFSDKQTCLQFSAPDHRERLFRQIIDRFDAAERSDTTSAYLVNQRNNRIIPITEDIFIIGRSMDKCHYFFEGDALTSISHVTITRNGNRWILMDMGAK